MGTPPVEPLVLRVREQQGVCHVTGIHAAIHPLTLQPRGCCRAGTLQAGHAGGNGGCSLLCLALCLQAAPDVRHALDPEVLVRVVRLKEVILGHLCLRGAGAVSDGQDRRWHVTGPDQVADLCLVVQPANNLQRPLLGAHGHQLTRQKDHVADRDLHAAVGEEAAGGCLHLEPATLGATLLQLHLKSSVAQTLNHSAEQSTILLSILNRLPILAGRGGVLLHVSTLRHDDRWKLLHTISDMRI